MSRDVSFDIDLSINNKNFSRYEIIQCLFLDGWNFLDNGKFTYLPLGDEDYDWNSVSMSDSEILDFLRIKSDLNETIGFSMTWANTNIGGQVLFFPNLKLSFCINNNIKKLEGNVIDVNWYLTRLLPIFDKKNILYTSILYQEYR